MTRRALLRRPLGLQRQPLEMDGPRRRFEDPRGPGEHSTLPYREATELLRCIEIMGEDSADYCRYEVLGEPMPAPTHRDVAGISTPVPVEATIGRDSMARLDVGPAKVTIKPDATTNEERLRDHAETTINGTVRNVTWSSSNGKVRVNVPSPPLDLTIQTTYGPGAKPGATSAYGRGTTATQRKRGDTSLRFHEGGHGLDFLAFLASNPGPIFPDWQGMTVAEVETAAADYVAAWKTYIEDMQHASVHATDCIGDTNKASAEIKAVCTDAHGAAP